MAFPSRSSESQQTSRRRRYSSTTISKARNIPTTRALSSSFQQKTSSSLSSCPSSQEASCRKLMIHHFDHEKTSLSLSSTRRLLWWSCPVLLSVALILLSSAFVVEADGKHAWERPGCHKVGHTRKMTIPDCMEFTITTNACRGYCESFAVPSAWYRLQNNPSQAITSVGQCCNIMETEDVTVNVWCVEGPKELVFKSAISCACYHCKKD